MSRRFIFVIGALAACHSHPSTLPWGPQLESSGSAVAFQHQVLALGSASTETSDREIQDLVRATQEVIASDAFQRNVWITEMAAGVNDVNDDTSGNVVLKKYVTPVKRTIAVIKNSRNSVAFTKFVGGEARVYLRKVVRDRWMSQTVEGRACAINTLAHEWTHTYTESGKQLYTDNGHYGSSKPLVSYTVGSIAQCAYLASQVKDVVFDVRACVQRVGTISFNPGTCKDGWAKTLTTPAEPSPTPTPDYWPTVTAV